MTEDRSTLTILFTDVEGSTSLATRLGDEESQRILARSGRLVREAVAEHGGREIKGLGDGYMCAFRGPRAAIAAASTAMREHADWEARAPDEAVRIRAGIHTGEVIEAEDDLQGEAVNAAARIVATAAAGEILVSETARGACGLGAGITFGERREVELRGFPEAFAVSTARWREPAAVGRPPLEQRIRFAEIEGRRIAWASAGEGPALVCPSPWVSSLESDWENEEYRGFIEALASENTVIRYDRPGTGLSDRHLPDDLDLDLDVRILERLLAEIGLESVSTFGISCGGCIAIGLAARNPDLVDASVYCGCYLDGSKLASDAVRDSLVSVIRASWGLGARMLSDIFIPGATTEEREAWTKFQQDAAAPDAAADLYELIYRYDATRAAAHASAPALVLHRRDDTAVAFRLGLELAAALPDARLKPLEGARHLPWQGDADAITTETLRFLAESRGATRTPTTPEPAAIASAAPGSREGPRGPMSLPELSPREVEVLRMVADGLSDNEIAERLVLSPHTVHRHVANIRTKLGQPSRAAAAAQAARLDLI